MAGYFLEPIQETASTGYTLEPVEEKPVSDVLSWRKAPTETVWDRVRAIFPDDSVAQSARATNALTYSQMLGISPSAAYEFHDEISQQVKDKLEGEKILTEKKGIAGAAKSAWDTSLVGMMANQKAPAPFESVSQAERWTQGMLSMGLDLPFFLAGYGIGGGQISGMAGAFGFTAGLRQMLVDRYTKGEVRDAADLIDRVGNSVRETVKGQIVGAFTGGAGEMAGPLLKAVAPGAATPIGWRAMNELAAMTTAGKLIEGQLPTARDFVDNAAILLTMHAGMKGYEAGKAEIRAVREKLQQTYIETGAHPKEVVAMVADEPMVDPGEDVTEVIDRVTDQIRVEMPQEKATGEQKGDGTGKESAKGEIVEPWSNVGRPEPQSVGETGVKNAVVDAERTARGAEPIESPVRKQPENWKELVIERVDNGEIDPRRIAERINNQVELGDHPTQPTPEETYALLYDKQRLRNEHKAIQDRIDAIGDKPTERAPLEYRRQQIEDALDANEQATKAVGTEWGLAGRARQEMMNEDYSVAAMIRRAKEDGLEVTPELRKRYEDISRKIEKAQKELDGLQESIAATMFEKTTKQAANEQSLSRRRQKREVKKEELDAEFDSLVSKFNKTIGGQLNVGIDPAGVKILVEMAVNRIEKGIVAAEDIIDSIHTALVNAGIEYSKRDIRDAISGYGITKQMSKEEVAVALREAKRQMQLISAYEDAKGGKAPAKTGLQRDKASDRVRELQREVHQAMRESGIDAQTRTPEERWRSAIEAVKTRLRNQITDLAKQIETGEKTPKKKGIEYDEEAKQLVAERDRLKETLIEIEGKPEMSPEQRTRNAISAVEKSISEYERRIKEGDLFPQKKEGKTPETPELTALKQKRDELKAAFKDMQLSSEDYALGQFRKRTERQIAEFERRIKENDFSTRKPKELPALTERELKLKFALEKAKQEYAKARVEDQIKNYGFAKNVGYYTMEAANLARALKTSFDLSAVLRQGAFIVLAHPIRGARAIPDMFRALASEEGQFKVNQEILSRKNYPLYERYKLFLSEHGQKLSQMEEVYMSRWSEKIPGVGASQRAYTTFLNKLRADSFDAMVEKWGENGRVTPEQGQAIANFVNVATGRGSVGGKDNQLGTALVSMNTVFFAPRFVLSRFQLALGQPMWKGDFQTRMRVAGEYGRFLTGVGIIYFLSMAAGADVEFDPRSSDFLKIRVDNARVDPMAGIAQGTVLMSRVISGETKKISGRVVPIRGEGVPYGGSNTADVIATFLRGKLAPAPGIGLDLATGKDVTGAPVTVYDIPEKTLLPLSFQDIYQAMQDQGVPMGMALALVSIFGMNMQVYENRGKP